MALPVSSSLYSRPLLRYDQTGASFLGGFSRTGSNDSEGHMERPPTVFARPVDRRRFCRETALLIAALAVRRVAANAAASKRDVGALADASYIYVATVRKDGNQSRAAP